MPLEPVHKLQRSTIQYLVSNATATSAQDTNSALKEQDTVSRMLDCYIPTASELVPAHLARERALLHGARNNKQQYLKLAYKESAK